MPVWAHLGIPPMQTLDANLDIRYEGPLQLNFGYTNVWKEFYVVVSSVLYTDPTEAAAAAAVPDETGEETTGKLAKKLFFRQSRASWNPGADGRGGNKPASRPVSQAAPGGSGSNRPVSQAAPGGSGSSSFSLQRHGVMHVFRSKKEYAVKRMRPVFHIPFVRAAYALWPDSPECLNLDAPLVPADADAGETRPTPCVGKIECSVLSVPQPVSERTAKKRNDAASAAATAAAFPDYAFGAFDQGLRDMLAYALGNRNSSVSELRRPSPQHVFFSVPPPSDASVSDKEKGRGAKDKDRDVPTHDEPGVLALARWIAAISAAYDLDTRGFDGALETGCVGMLHEEVHRVVDTVPADPAPSLSGSSLRPGQGESVASSDPTKQSYGPGRGVKASKETQSDSRTGMAAPSLLTAW